MAITTIVRYIKPRSMVDYMEDREYELAKAVFDHEERELLEIPERYYVGFFGGKVDSIWELKG